MGLDIGYQDLSGYLESAFPDDSPSRRLAADLIREEITRQTGSFHLPEPGDFSGLIGDRVGSYGALHYLRSFAARVAGYTLAEAYRLPQTTYAFEQSVSEGRTTNETFMVVDAALGEPTSGPFESEDEDRGESDDDDYKVNEDDDFLEVFGATADVTFPVSATRLEPFPFPHLVQFSDADGIYLPVEFPRPFVVGDVFVGSSTHLHDELSHLNEEFKKHVLLAMSERRESTERFLSFARHVWLTLEGAAHDSIKHQVPFIYC